jgi:tetratricopeptide (TPR) repeat protein
VETQKRGDLQGAVLAYRSYLQVDPASVPAHANLGAALAGLGRFEEAISEYRAALRLDPDDPALQFNLGLAHFKSARIPDAAADFSPVVAAQPDNKHAVILLADCYLRMAEYKKVIDLRPTTSCGVPDILINGQLVLELKIDPDKGGRDRGIGQCADYSREFVTWMVIIGGPAWRIQELEDLLVSRGLDGIKVVSFT